jgi:hypothetical protein
MLSAEVAENGHSPNQRGKRMIKSMKRIAVIFACALALTAAHAQAPPALDQAPTTPKLNLTLEQRHVIKEFIKDMNVPRATTSAHDIGDAIPADAASQPMPADIGRKVPQVKTHRLIVTAERILIVDPKDNKVAEVIELN